MAKLSSDGKYVIVEKGDTLSAIAKKYANGISYKKLAAYNNIDNPDHIVIGDKIYIKEALSSTPTVNNTNRAVIKQFGIQATPQGSINQLLATWTWSKSNTENYAVKWEYQTGNGVWLSATDGTSEYKYSTCAIPDKAIKVRFKVKPVAKKKKNSKGKETPYWTANWSTEKVYQNPPALSGTLNVTLKGVDATLDVTGIDSGLEKVQFNIIKKQEKRANTGGGTKITASTKTSSDVSILYPVSGLTGTSSYKTKLDLGSEYTFCYRVKDRNLYSDWSAYVGPKYTSPGKVTSITSIKARTSTSITLGWSSVYTADDYEIEYTTDKTYFDTSSQVQKVTTSGSLSYQLTGLETGKEYFIRIRAINSKITEAENKNGAWSDIKSIPLGSEPVAPTTWSSTTTAMVDEPLTLYWVHNAEDGSSQTKAKVELIFDDGSPIIHEIENTNKDKSFIGDWYTLSYIAPEDLEEGEVSTSFCKLTLTGYSEGTVIKWRAITAGITETFDEDEWSIQRKIDVYAKPTLDLSITDSAGNAVLDTIESFPFNVYGVTGPDNSSQKPISYHLAVTADEAYETVDDLGNAKLVSEGDVVYSKYFDTSDPLNVELSAGNIDLENNISYLVTGTAHMDSGLTAESTVPFVVSWTERDIPEPNAEITIDPETLTAQIKPYCEEFTPKYYKVIKSYNRYTATTEEVDIVWGEIVENTFTETGEEVYSGILDDETELYYYETLVGSYVEGLTLSVYRREYDGTFTEIQTGIDSAKQTTVSDPHPALDRARYRIVAITNETGAVSYYDMPGEPVNEAAVVIQWDENWTTYDISGDEELSQQPWTGSMLKIPYNIDVSDNRSPDVSLVEYIGRKHPVSYYGTQLGETASWSVTIPKEDKETLYALRRLSIWMGDVYVREPSGSGYWAKITVSFSQKHCDTTIPVSLDIVRVEGGM